MSRWQERTFTVQREGGDVTLDVSFSFVAGSAPSGLTGPPENYDPGSLPDVDVIDVAVIESDDPAFPVGSKFTLTPDEESDFHLSVAQDPPEEDGPDPDDLRNQRRDDDFNYFEGD